MRGCSIFNSSVENITQFLIIVCITPPLHKPPIFEEFIFIFDILPQFYELFFYY